MPPQDSDNMTLDVRREGAAAVVYLGGAVSMDQADRLQQALEQLAAEQVGRIVLDLHDLEFISSAGLGAIISGHLKCRHHQGEIRLVGPRPSVRQLLQTTRLTKLFGIYDDVQQAVGA